MQRLHFTARLSTDLDGEVLFESDSQDPPEEGGAVEPWGGFVGGAVNEYYCSGSSKRCRPLGGNSTAKSRRCRLPGRTTQAGQAPVKAAPENASRAGGARAGTAQAGATPAGGPGYTKTQHQRDARRMLSTCVHASY